jgi:ribose/xylose/arabinose/galactoside ABC-type transport system permease subunit
VALRLFGGLAALIAVAAVMSPHTPDGQNIFLNRANLFDVLARVANVGLLAVGMTLVILTGGIDLSVGSVLSLGTVVAAMLLLERGWHPGARLALPALAFVAGIAAAAAASRLVPLRLGAGRAAVWWLAFLVAAGLVGSACVRMAPHGLPLPLLLLSVMAVGLIAGWLNGALVAAGGLQPFIATLSTMIGIWGLAYLVTGEENARRHISTGAGTAAQVEAFTALGSRLEHGVAGFPVPALFFLGAALLAHLMLCYTPLGRRIYAIGGNEDAARLSGVPVARTKLLVYGVSGLLSALAGALWAAQYEQGFTDAGQGAELEAIAAVVIGGTSLAGGRGGIPGTVVGVLMFGVLNNILVLREYTTAYQRAMTGAVIAVAVLLQSGRLQAALRRLLGRPGSRKIGSG